MEREKLEIVLEEVLEELRTVKDTMLEQKQQTWQLQEKINDFEKKLEERKPVTPPVNIISIQAAIETGISKIRQIVAEQPKSIIYERRFLLFPEHYSRDYYRVIFRLIMWLTVVCIGTYLFSLGKIALENNREVRLKQIETKAYKNAWEYLYNQADKKSKKSKKRMDTIWNNSNK